MPPPPSPRRPAPSYVADGPEATPQLCSEALAGLQARYDAQAVRLEAVRKERLPGRR